MKSIEIHDVGQLMCIGESKGNSSALKERLSRLIKDKSNKKSLYVAVGTAYNGGINDDFKEINNILSKTSSHLCIVRGEGESHAAFNEENAKKISSIYSRIHVIEDYTLVKTGNVNILMIGGSLSVNRLWKKKHSELIRKMNPDLDSQFYALDEGLYMDEELAKEVIASGEKIDVVITSAAPLFVGPFFYMERVKWTSTDDALKKDSMMERTFCDYLFHLMVKYDNVPNTWVYTKYDEGEDQAIISDTRFVKLLSKRHIRICSLKDNTGDETVKKSTGVESLKKVLNTIHSFTPYRHNLEEGENIGMDEEIVRNNDNNDEEARPQILEDFEWEVIPNGFPNGFDYRIDPGDTNVIATEANTTLDDNLGF